MRIKEVCKETGLTDKAIRLYINSRLISPSYTENYAGRKNYSFDSNDVETLKKIAILRRYNFSVNDIKQMLESNESIPAILENHLSNTQHNVEESSMILTNLNNAHDNFITTIDELCDVLSENLEQNNFDIINAVNSLWNKIKSKIPLLAAVCIIGFFVSVLLLIVLTVLLSKLFLLFA